MNQRSPSSVRQIGVDQPTPRVASWLSAGWGDLRAMPAMSLAYGLGFALLSWSLIGVLWLVGLEWMLLPAISGALLVGPVIAVGLYRMSAERAQGVRLRVAAPGQIALIGGVLMVLLMAWIRAATIIYALFYGLTPFPGFAETLSAIFFTIDGVAMIVVGTIVGGLFAALTFAITIYAIPMLVEHDIDAFTAMARSFSAATHNMALTLRWGFAVTSLAVIGFATGMVGMIVIFPLLGFATWRAYCDVFAGTRPHSSQAFICGDAVVDH